jgi:hypothetical protein
MFAASHAPAAKAAIPLTTLSPPLFRVVLSSSSALSVPQEFLVE